MPLDKTYQPHDIEPRWGAHWENKGLSEPNGSGKPYCIMLPPPNVTGTLHMGHGFQHTLMDALIRYHRMQGDNTLWQAGTDHAGIATQMVVERQLTQQNISRYDLGRDAFLKKVWAWKHASGHTITTQMRRLGTSLDWSRERFTMDDNISRATMEAFVRLYEAGLIYRGKKLVNWDPQLKTAISDLEVSTETEKGHLWHIRYPIVNSEDFLVVATTRPETMLGDTAVSVHPEDERYQKFIGKKIALPLSDRLIPIIADEMVDRAFGTGCVKITPAHDFNDYATGQRHQLPLINIMTLDAKLNDDVPAPYRGLDRFVARKKIVADLNALGLLVKIDDHEHNVPRGDRSGVVIEPLLTDQWFVKMDDMAKEAMTAYEKNKVEFIPENWGKTYLQWLANIQDWCISRQLWWGHRIPVWYDDQGNHYVGLHEADARKRNKLGTDVTLHQDNDVLDTWFSASLWPFATLGWPDKTVDLKTFYPTSVLVTGFDIIFFWVARMVMMGLKLAGDLPFKQVYITGLIRDSQGQKMSKSKGNILDPIDLIDGISLPDLLDKRVQGLMQPQMEKAIRQQTEKEFPDGIPASGTDALRFTFCALATTGRNINFDIARLAGYRNFCNKIWNATRFVLMNVGGWSRELGVGSKTVADHWILHQLQLTIDSAHKDFREYRFDQLAKTLYEFVWNDYCDWYLELSKCELARTDITDAKMQGTKHTLLFVLESIMRLLHPIMPYITEEIWQKISPMLGIQGESIMIQPYPEKNSAQINTNAEKEIELTKMIVTKIRDFRGEKNISPAKKINFIFKTNTEASEKFVEKNQRYIKLLAKCNFEWASLNGDLPSCLPPILIENNAVQTDFNLRIYPIADAIDIEAELIRLIKEIEKQAQIENQLASRLANPGFRDKAPHTVVAEAQAQLTAAIRTREKLNSEREKLEQAQFRTDN